MSAPEYPYSPSNPGLPRDVSADQPSSLTTDAQADLADIAGEAKAQVAAIADEAMDQVGKVAEKAKGIATEQKDLLAEQMSGVSNALQQVASDLDRQGEGSAQYVRTIADSAKRLTSLVEDNDVDSLLAIAQDFGRRQPAAFMGAAALLGFAASRFVLASAHRSKSQPSPAQAYPDGGSDGGA